jgi:PIN domain nuclease of toxin-antitoxin system
MVILDTHVLVWARIVPRKMSRTALKAAERARDNNEAAISAFSLYELASYFARGEVKHAASLEESVRLFTEGLIVLPITHQVASLATYFPEDFPRDPGDRLIAATARAEDCALITADERIQRSKLIKTIW